MFTGIDAIYPVLTPVNIAKHHYDMSGLILLQHFSHNLLENDIKLKRDFYDIATSQCI